MNSKYYKKSTRKAGGRWRGQWWFFRCQVGRKITCVGTSAEQKIIKKITLTARVFKLFNSTYNHKINN